MAATTGVYSQSKKTLAVHDYAGTPATLSIPLIVGSWSAVSIDAVTTTEIMVASSTGASRHATPVQGTAGGMKISFKYWIKDKKTTADKNPYSLLCALAKGTVSGTAHSSETYTNQTSGGGKLMCKLVLTENDENGVVSTSTFPVYVDTHSESGENDTLAGQVDCVLAGAITIA